MRRVLSVHAAIVAVALLSVGGCRSYVLRPTAVVTTSPNDPSTPQAVESLIVRGTVTYLQRVAMHPSAVVELNLWDLAGQPALPTRIAGATIRRPGEVPVEFEFPVDAAKIDPLRDYGVTARIVVDGAVLFTTEAECRVLTKGHPDTVQLVLARPAS